ncbi:hypothetical protein [Microbulbifer spongiae]|uniref:Uncharacterized protein n=1 Tax=Microbulbifer spongiae TaxID=2944933 RepID=A0ABY9E5W5_9GAMM|nr:hypothetical protein [Microbulbifer sp. MI-G]WKD48413.1 hypothetical protein M8T91_10770 [Microbulbifer sp. MI-G]
MLIDYVKIDVVEVQDQRNLPLIQSVIASLPTSSALSAVDAGSTARINIAAHNVQFGFGTISYNSGSISGLSFSRKYYVYCDDPGPKGVPSPIRPPPTTPNSPVVPGVGR